jgi:sacsin
LSTDDRKILLKYLFERLSDIKYIIDLELLPLANGKWTKFKQASGAVRKIYVETYDHPRSLLPGLEGTFLQTDIAPKKCRELAANSEYIQTFLIV